MPTYYARASGNVNAAIWSTTPTGAASDLFSSFTNQDVLVANNFTITVNTSFTVAEIRGDSTGGATVTSSGGFFVSTGGVPVTITANVNALGATVNGLVNSAANQNLTIVGNITAGVSAAVTAGSTVTVTGSVQGGSTGNGITASANLSVTGSVTGGTSTGVGININNAGSVVTVTGTVTAGSGSAGIQISSGSTLSITGNVTGGGVTAVTSNSSGTTTIVGTVTGGVAAGAAVTSTGTLTATRAKGGPNANSAVGISNGAAGSIVNVSEIEFGDLGASPVSGPIRLTDASTNVAIMYRFNTTKKTLVDANASGLMPAASNVRSGVVYNGGNSTGAMAVPAAGSVALGVPVDNTTGTAILTQANVETALGAFSGGRLANCATVASTGQQIADAVTA